MTMLWLGAGAAYAAAALCYYHGRFGLAALLGLVFGGLDARVVVGTLGPVAGGAVLLPLLLLPAAYLGVHWVDARRGLFNLPTIYSIPFAFLACLLLHLVAGGALLLASP